jgi:hypothetical protein
MNLRSFLRHWFDSDLAGKYKHYLAKERSFMAEGMSREEAERKAKFELGRIGPLMERIRADVKYAFRQLRRNPGLSITAIVTLALGIGTTTVIFSIMNAVMLKPLPFPGQDRLIWISQRDNSLPGVVPESLSYPDYFDWRTQNRTLSGIASYSGGSVTMQAGSEPQRLDAQTVSANFFQVLGVAPMLGRDFRWDDEKPGNRTVMLSHALWQSAFGSSKDIVGTSIRLGDHSYVVAGVMPDGGKPWVWESEKIRTSLSA